MSQFTVLANGNNLGGFEAVNLSIDFLQATSKAHFTMPAKINNKNYPIQLNDEITLFINNIQVKAHLAENGVEDDLVILAESGEVKLTLATSFQCKLQNWAYIIGDEGYIAIPNFWRADQCTLHKLDEEIAHFSNQRTSLGFNFEAQAVGEAIINNHLEHNVMTHHTSYLFQQTMEQVKKLVFSE